MLALLARYKGIAVVVALLLLPLVLLYAQTKKPGARGPVVGVVLDVASGIERALLFAVGGIVDATQTYVVAVGNAEELSRLRANAQQGAGLRARIKELETENDAMRALARAAIRIEGPRPIGARVIARVGYPLVRLVTLDVGGGDGVRRGDGVVDANGVVGLVLATGRRSCDVLLLSDPSSSIDVVTQRSRARGVLRGEDSDERYGAQVEDFDKLRDVKPGETLVTSGIGTRFPAGLLVGTIVEASAPDDSLYVRARVKPAARFDTLEHVIVLVNRDPPRGPHLGREPQDEAAPATDATDVDAGPAPAVTTAGVKARTTPDGGALAVDVAVAVDAGASDDGGVVVQGSEGTERTEADAGVGAPNERAATDAAATEAANDAGMP